MHRRRHVGHLRARRPRTGHHGLEHLGGHYAQAIAARRATHQVALRPGDLLGPHLHAEVAARDHYPVALGHDRVDALQRLGLFYLGDQAGGDQPRRAHGAPAGHEVRGAAHEAERHVIRAAAGRGLEIPPVLGGQRRRRQARPRQVDSLVRAEHASDDHPGANAIPAHGLHDQLQPAVGQQHALALAHFAGQGPVADADRSGVGLPAPWNQVDSRPLPQAKPLVRTHPGADLGAAQVGQQRHLAAERARLRARVGHALQVLAVSPVGEVESQAVHTCPYQAAQPLPAGGCRPDGGNDLGASSQCQTGSFPGPRF